MSHDAKDFIKSDVAQILAEGGWKQTSSRTWVREEPAEQVSEETEATEPKRNLVQRLIKWIKGKLL